MKRWWLLFLLLPCSLFGERIYELLPPFSNYLYIEPAVPEEYAMKSCAEPPDLYAGVVWGLPEDLDKLSYSIDSTYIFVKLSGDVIQKDEEHFAEEEDFSVRLEMMGHSDISIHKQMWGDYPLLIAEFEDPSGRRNYIAWAGLNATVGGWALMFTFQYPEEQDAPTPEQLTLWTTFLSETTEL